MTTRAAALAVVFYLMPAAASADLIMTIGASGQGASSDATGAYSASIINGFANPFASNVSPGGLACGPCATIAFTAESLGEIDATGHVRMVAYAEPTPANPAPPAAYVEAILTDRLLVAGPVTFDIEIDTSLFALGGGFGQADYSFILSGGASGFSFFASREYDMTAGSSASWSATTVDGGNSQIGEPGFFQASVTLVPLPFESHIDLVLQVQASANCSGLGCKSFVSSLNSACLRATGNFSSTSGYSFDCDISPGPTPAPVPEPGTALLLMGVLASAWSCRRGAPRRRL